MESAVPRPTPSPSSRKARPPAVVPSALPCPCGRAHPLVECCLPVAQRLRAADGQCPSPFDELRATGALLLWSLLAAPRRTTPATRALGRAARRFWGTALRQSLEGGGPSAQRMPPATSSDYGLALFDRTWGVVDHDTRTWLLADLPSFARADAVLAELSLDWLLWDLPWLRDRPGAHWTMRAGAAAERPRVRATYEAILRSRLGLWDLQEHLPRRGFRLIDRLTGDCTLLHTESDPWPEAGERLMLARIYAFGDWRLLGGRCLLLDPMAVDRLLTALRHRAAALSAPPPHDPRWRAWLKAELIPLVAAQWLSARLAPPPADRYHGTYC